MKTVYKVSTLAGLITASSLGLMAADPVETSLDSSFSKLEKAVPGKFSLNARLRYESFDLDTPSGNLADGTPADRDGPSLRIRYGYTTPDFSGFTAMVEGETVTRVGGHHYDIHPLDDAGDGTDLNQAWVQYEHDDLGKAKLGRQIYTLDDQRFIGNVGWRQNIQTFDGATGMFKGIDKLTVQSFFFEAANRVNADYFVIDVHGINVSYKILDDMTLTAFYYNFDNSDNEAWESDLFGGRITGSFTIQDQKIVYAGSAVSQDNSDTGDAAYFAGDVSTTFAGVTIGAGFEYLEDGFSTPLATVHKFNGFADVFATASLGGIANGLEDYYGYVGYTIPLGSGIKTKVIYHTFDPQEGSGDYGDEIDFVASYKINKYFDAIAKYGSYNSDGGSGGVGGLDQEMFTFEVNFIY